MPIPPIRLPLIRLPAASGPWLALAASGSVWLLFLLFGLPAAARPGALAPWQPAAALGVVGVLSGALLTQTFRRPLTRGSVAVMLLLAWGGALALHQHRYVYPRWYILPDARALISVALGALAIGLLTGLVAAPLARWRLRRRDDENGRLLAGLALGCASIVALTPLDPSHPLLSPFAYFGRSSLLMGIPEHVYVLIKGTMIWVPLGFVFAVGGLSPFLWRWVPAIVVTFFLVGWAFFPKLSAFDLMQVLFAPVGIWAGIWLGERAARGAELAQEHGPIPAATPSEPPRPAPDLPLFALARPYPIAIVPALGLLALAAWLWWAFPAFHLSLGIALALYLGLLLLFRHAWLVAIPALLPALDLAPWTGRFFFDESDLFLLVTLGAALLHRRDPEAGPFLGRPVALLGVLFAATTLIALWVGLLPLAPLDANAFTTYFSHYNALRVAKGFAWGLSFFLLLRWTLPRGSELAARLFTLGLLLGLIAVVLIGVTERSQYAALLDLSSTYRITASFSSMHTGDAHLPAFLALAVPFVWLGVMQWRSPLALLAGLGLLAGAVYLVVVTVTRASFLALALELVLLALFWLRGLRGDWVRIATSLVAFAAMTAVGAGLLYLGTQGSFFQQRLSQVERDADTRLGHWGGAIGMMDRDLATRLFGMGLGSFPETYLLRNPGGAVPGNFRYGSEDGNGYLLLGSGETLYLAQRVPIQPFTRYGLSFDLKGEGQRLQIEIPLCEKHLLNSRRCVWGSYDVPGGSGWQHKEVTLDSGQIGHGNRLTRPPAELYLYNEQKDQLLEVDNLSLRDPRGNELLRNGGFSAGGDFWFFRTHDHLAWHIKNLWVSMLFEQGWAGLVAFNLLLLAALMRLAGPAWRGAPVPAAALTAGLGFLAVGLFASPFDAPRLTALFLAVLALGLHGAGRSGVREGAGR